MTTFLERILTTKQAELQALEQRLQNVAERRRAIAELPPCRGFARALRDGDRLHVIAEVKKASPSRGLIASDFDPVAIARSYEAAGAAAISVLTDETYFQGSMQDLRQVRQAVSIPVLRKDFIIGELQIDEARLAGADAVLLICAALTTDRLLALTEYAHALGLDTLMEVHSEAELAIALTARPSVIGVNNRDLHTFAVTLETSEQVIAKVPADRVAVAESGIHTAVDAARMAACGARAVLVGESLMRAGVAAQVAEHLTALRVPLPTTPVAAGDSR